MSDKPIHSKPGLYTYFFHFLKDVATSYGYNLVIHGSVNRDLDLIAIPWQEVVKPHGEMIKEFCEILGGKIMMNENIYPHGYSTIHHGRMQYVINLNRGGYYGEKYVEDPQYYIDISVMPAKESK